MNTMRRLMDAVAGRSSDDIATRKYPNTPEGAKQFLSDMSIWDTSNAKARQDPQVEGVWEVTGITAGTKKHRYNGRAIVWLAGYRDPWGKTRQYNDFESEELPGKPVMKEEKHDSSPVTDEITSLLKQGKTVISRVPGAGGKIKRIDANTGEADLDTGEHVDFDSFPGLEISGNIDHYAITQDPRKAHLEKQDIKPKVDEAVVEVPAGLRGEPDSDRTHWDAERFLRDLGPEDTVDTEVIDPESGEVLDWPTRDEQKRQEGELQRKEQEQKDKEEDERLDKRDQANAPFFFTPRDTEDAYDILNDLHHGKAAEFYNIGWVNVAETVEDPESMLDLDYDVDYEVPVALARKDGERLDSDDYQNIRCIIKAVRLASTLQNVGVTYMGVTDGGKVAHLSPSFL